MDEQPSLHIYRARYEFEANISLGQVALQKDDTIEVNAAMIPEDTEFQSPRAWLRGYNRRTAISGNVPGNFLEYIESVIAHDCTEAYLLQPALCNMCQDYMWGGGIAVMRCQGCLACFHQECHEIVRTDQVPCTKGLYHAQTVNSAKPVQNWTNANVIEWMAAANMSNYVEKFKVKKIDGSLLVSLDDARLRSFGIEDPFHQEALLSCVNQLCGRAEEVLHTDEMEECSGTAEEHQLVEQTFASLQTCHRCNKYLCGMLRQGLECKVCGLRIHKQCRLFKLPVCGSAHLSRRRRLSFTSVSYFGGELQAHCASSQDGRTPDILSICTKEIEHRLRDDKSMQWGTFYRTPTCTESVNKLKRLLDETEDRGLASMSFAGVKSKDIGGLVKKYLRELYNPLIPVEYYNSFIAAASSDNAITRSKDIANLVNELPEAHNHTLNFVMAHLYRITYKSTLDNSPKLLTQVFCHIMLRPAWDEIIKLSHNTKGHMIILETLYSNIAKELPDPHSSLMGVAAAAAYVDEPLEKCPWFWSEVTKEEVNERMAGTFDGSFLVRRATSYSTLGDYTLTLRKGGMNRLIKIYHKNGKYGFSEPYEFDSIQRLVEHFTTHSLSEYNRQLNCTLDYPVVYQMQPENAVDDSVIFHDLRQIQKEYLETLNTYDALLALQNKSTQDIQMLYQAHDSFKELVKVFEEQLELHRAHSKNVASHEFTKLQQNSQLLQGRLTDITLSKNRLESSIEAKTAENRMLISQINSKKPELKALGKKGEQLRNTLLHKGHDKKYIDELLDSTQQKVADIPVTTLLKNAHLQQTTSDHEQSDYMPVEPARLLAHRDQSTWYRTGVDRGQAKEILACRNPGTFLIRGPREPNEYVLSIVDQNRCDIHCKIQRGPDGYGFAEPFMIHEELMDLVLHYRETSLAEHNPQLDSTLDYPAYAPI